jgi:O-antigen/teichoic acid export membrane protein
VALFVTTRTLANLVRQIIGTLGLAMWPDLTGMEARQEYARLRAVHRLLVPISTTLCIAVAAALWYEGGEVIKVWTRGKLTPDVTLLRFLLVQLVLQCPWLASSIFTAASNHHKKLSWFYLSSAIVGVGVAALLVKRWGTWAVPLGLMAGEALACYHFVIQDTCRMLEEPYGPFMLKTWLSLTVTAAAALAAGFAAHYAIPGPALIRWVGVGAMTSLVSLAVAWVIWLTRADKLMLMSRWRPLRVMLASKV